MFRCIMYTILCTQLLNEYLLRVVQFTVYHKPFYCAYLVKRTFHRYMAVVFKEFSEPNDGQIIMILA